MMTYELIIVLDGKTTPAKKKSTILRIEKLIATLGGKVIETEDWGVKDLAYQIKKSTSGLFLIFTLELEQSLAKSLPAKLKLEEQFIRYLLLKPKGKK